MLRWMAGSRLSNVITINESRRCLLTFARGGILREQQGPLLGAPSASAFARKERRLIALLSSAFGTKLPSSLKTDGQWVRLTSLLQRSRSSSSPRGKNAAVDSNKKEEKIANVLAEIEEAYEMMASGINHGSSTQQVGEKNLLEETAASTLPR